jgi:hypothetical protein
MLTSKYSSCFSGNGMTTATRFSLPRTRKHPRMCARSHPAAGTGRQEGGQAETKQKDTQARARIQTHEQSPIALNADNQVQGTENQKEAYRFASRHGGAVRRSHMSEIMKTINATSSLRAAVLQYS